MLENNLSECLTLIFEEKQIRINYFTRRKHLLKLTKSEWFFLGRAYEKICLQGFSFGITKSRTMRSIKNTNK